MIKTLSAVVAISVVVVASASWACGAPPPPPTPGRPGTAVAEAGGSVSIFTGSAGGYTWERMTLPSQTRTFISTFTGELSGSVETDARVNTAITGQAGQLVELSTAGVTPLSASTGAQTTVFGATVDDNLRWHVLAYVSATQTVTLFTEIPEGGFTETSSLHADCGSVAMLDAVVESDGSVLGLCGTVAVELRDGALVTLSLPVTALGMVRGTAGKAVAYGVASSGTDVAVMTHDGNGWNISSTIASAVAPQLVLPLDETSVVVRQPAGFVAYSQSNGSWQASAPLDATLPVTSALNGSPARVLSGQYELTLHTNDGTPNGAWTSTDLGILGTQPVNPGPTQKTDSIGCSIVGTGIPLALLAAMTLARLRRREAKRA